jgi:hypothetical protein
MAFVQNLRSVGPGLAVPNISLGDFPSTRVHDAFALSLPRPRFMACNSFEADGYAATQLQRYVAMEVLWITKI